MSTFTLVESPATNLRIVCLSKRINHHTKSGGYDQMVRHLGAIQVNGPPLQSVVSWLMGKVWEYTSRGRLRHPSYGFSDRIAEEVAFWTAWRYRAQIVHALYGEEQISALLHRSSLLPGGLVATFHLPLAQVRAIFDNVPNAVMRRLAGVVVVGSREVAGFEDWIGQGKVVFVPHGVDTISFQPAPSRSNGAPRLLFVGWHMRDFETAHITMDLCAKAKLDVQFDVVLRRDKYMFFTGCSNVTYHSGLSEHELLQLYQKADALFLPLVDATANNSVLESLACGTPVITSDVGSIRDYVNETCGWLLPPSNPGAAFACVAALAADPTLATSRRSSARAKAEQLSWPVVSTDLLRSYARLAATGRFAP